MATITEPMALDASFNTTETNPRNIADVLAEMGEAIAQSMGRQANEVAYDNTTSGLSADDVQEAIDELAAEKVDKVTGKGLSTNDYTTDEKNKLAGIEAGAEVNVQSDWAQTDSNADDYIKNKQLVTEPIEELQNDVAGTQSISGNPITLTDAAPINAESLVVELEPQQDLHGYDFPWVGGAGKNKLDITTSSSSQFTRSGEVFTNTVTDTRTFFRLQIRDSNTTLFGKDINATGVTVSDVFTISNDTSSISIRHSGSQADLMIFFSQTIKAGSYKLVIDVTGYNPSVIGGLSFKNAMLIPSTETNTDFAPYSNICPITGYTECEVDDVGKNLFDSDSMSNFTKSGDEYIGKASYWQTDLNNNEPYSKGFKANTQYTFSVKAKNDSNYGTATGFRFYYTDGTYDQVYFNDNAYKYYTLTSAQGKTVDHISAPYNYQVDLYIKECQLEEGTTATTYEPYQSSNAIIQFGQTVYGGSVDVTEGGTDDEWGVVEFDGSNDENWSMLGSGSASAYCMQIYLDDAIDYTLSTDIPPIKANYLKAIRSSDTWGNYDGFVASSAVDSKWLYTGIKSITSVADWRTYLANNPLQVCYKKATPDTISTPPTELKMFKGTNNLSADGVMQIGYQKDNVVGELKGEIEQHLEMPYLRILDNDVDTEIKNYQLYYRLVASAYTLVNLAEMLQHRFLFVEIIQNPSGTSNDKLLHSVLIDPRTIDGFEYQMKAGTGDTVCIKTNIPENKLDLYVQSTGTHTSGDPTDYYVTIRLVD